MLDARYPEDWTKISLITRKSTKYHCSLCYTRFHSSELVAHHITYKFLGFSPIGLWGVGWLIVPVCRDCHGVVHRDVNFIWTRNKFNRRQRLGYAIKLILSYWLLRLITLFIPMKKIS